MKQHLNIPVSVTALVFDRQMVASPKRIEWGGRIYDFLDRGIRVQARRGEHITSTVTCSDGQNNYCLRLSGSQWILVGVY